MNVRSESRSFAGKSSSLQSVGEQENFIPDCLKTGGACQGKGLAHSFPKTANVTHDIDASGV